MIENFEGSALTWFRDNLDAFRAWATFGFAAIAAYIGLRKYRMDAAAMSNARQKPWSMRRLDGALDPGATLFAIRVDDAARNAFRLTRIAVLRPRGAQIAIADFQYETTNSQGREAGYIPTRFASRLDLDVDMTPDGLGMPGAARRDYSTLPIFVSMPSRPFWRRSDSTRLIASLTIESMSAAKSEMRIIVRSHPIAWAASNPAITK